MGDRANIKFKQANADIWLYGHWAGCELAEQLKEGLIAAKPRWTDEIYGTRIIVSHVLKDALDQETGWGLSTYPCDNERDVLEVDFKAQEVRLLSREGFHESKKSWPATVKRKWTFAEYADLPDATEAVHRREEQNA